MAYRLQKNESLDTGLKRIAEEQVTAAIRSLQSEPLETGIYQARRCLKKFRSLLRLLAVPLGPIYVQENCRLRDVARQFSALRDNQVSLELIDQFAGQYQRKSTLNPQRQALAARRLQLDQGTDWTVLRQGSIAALTATRKRIEDWPLRNLSDAGVEAEIRRTHKQSRLAWETAERTRAAEDYHELRKRVKRELNQNRLLGSESGPDELKQLSDWLGDHHNLAVLLLNLEQCSKRFQGMVQRRLRELENQISSISIELYRPKPQPTAIA